MEGLKGSGPLVTVTFEVINPDADYLPTISEPSSSSSVSTFLSRTSQDLQGAFLTRSLLSSADNLRVI